MIGYCSAITVACCIVLNLAFVPAMLMCFHEFFAGSSRQSAIPHKLRRVASSMREMLTRRFTSRSAAISYENQKSSSLGSAVSDGGNQLRTSLLEPNTAIQLHSLNYRQGITEILNCICIQMFFSEFMFP
jgi:hypothetical protein